MLKVGKSELHEQIRKSSKEFKEEGRLLATSGKTDQQLSRKLGVSGMSLLTWREQAIANGDPPDQVKLEGGRIHYSVLKLENERLKKELANARANKGMIPRLKCHGAGAARWFVQVATGSCGCLNGNR